MAASAQKMSVLCPKKHRYMFLSVYKPSFNTHGILFHLLFYRDFHRQPRYAHSQEGGETTGPTLNSCLCLYGVYTMALISLPMANLMLPKSVALKRKVVH